MLGINEPPKQAASMGGIRRWKDGRNMPDVHATMYYYGATDLPVYMRLNLGTEMPEQYRIQGSQGVLEVSGNTLTFAPQTGKDQWPSYYTGSYPHALREAYQMQWHKEHDLQAGQAPPLTETVSFSTPDFDDTRPHLWNFFEEVRTRKPVVEDVVGEQPRVSFADRQHTIVWSIDRGIGYLNDGDHPTKDIVIVARDIAAPIDRRARRWARSASRSRRPR